MGPPLCIVQVCGRSNATVSSSTYGLLFHFARYLVPTPTGPSVSFSMASHLGFHSELGAVVGEVVEASSGGRRTTTEFLITGIRGTARLTDSLV